MSFALRRRAEARRSARCPDDRRDEPPVRGVHGLCNDARLIRAAAAFLIPVDLLQSDDGGADLLDCVDERGRIVARGDQFQPAVVRGEVRPLRGLTPHGRFGDLPAVLLMVLLLALGLLLARRALKITA